MELLLDQINQWYHNNSEYPTVKVTKRFRLDYWEELSHQICTGIEVEIDDTLNEDWRLV